MTHPTALNRWPLWAACLLLPFSVAATEPEHVSIDTFDELAKGESVSTSIISTGELLAAPEVSKLTDIDAKQIWGLVEEKAGTHLVATSPDGKLFRVGVDGKPVLVTKFAESHLYAIARNSKGEVFVGTSPDGKIYKLVPDQSPEVYFEPNEKYIWALAFDAEDNLYAATGTEGRLFKITAKDTGDIYYDSDEVHLRSLAFDTVGKVLVGSAESGYIYHVAEEDKAVVLHSTGRQEVNQIVVTEDGAIWFSASGKASKDGKPSPSKSKTPALSILSLLSKSTSNSSDSSSSSNTGSTLYRIDESAYAFELWDTEETILGLALDGNNVIATTGKDGYIYSINPRGDVTREAKLEAGNVSAIARTTSGGFALGSSAPSKFFVQAPARVKAGKYESEVIDSELFARWGAVRVHGDGKATIRTRSGNTPKPDKSWYDWVGTNDGKSQSLPARYLQVEVTITSGTIDRIEVVYLTKNLAPKVESIDILSPGIGFEVVPAPPKPESPKSEKLVRNMIGDDADDITEFDEGPTRYLPRHGHGQRTVIWEASDPNEDELTYSLHYRSKIPGSTWHQLAKDIAEPIFSWDTSGWPDGDYLLKVIASDAKDNAPNDAETGELVSKVMLVDNTPPQIRVSRSVPGRVSFTVSDERSLLSSITVSRDGAKFELLRPVDGILDSRKEVFEIDLAQDEQLFIRAEDEGGNISSSLANP